MGSYRALLTLPGGDLPVGLHLEPEGTTTVGYLVNGRERVKLGGKQQHVPLHAHRGQEFRFFVAEVKAILDQLLAES